MGLKILSSEDGITNPDQQVLERAMYRISPSGYGIHWPLIDEDLSINGILRDFAK